MNVPDDISRIVETMLCCSCGACAAVCRREAISYRETLGGHLFPIIDRERCTACGLCCKVCPSVSVSKEMSAALRSSPFEGTALECYVGKSADGEIYANSQSGGVVSALLLHLLETRQIGAAVVSTMVSGNPPRPVVLCAESREQLLAAQKSKYCPIPVLSILGEVRKRNLPIALVGLPCHLHGLSSLTDIDATLGGLVKYKIGLVCQHALTYCAMDFLIRQAGLAEKEVLNFEFKNKAYPRYPGNVVIDSPGTESIVLPDGSRDRIKKAFTPARCRVCFDKMNVLADITVGDPHGLKGIDRHHGESEVVVRTEQGRKLIREALLGKRLNLRKVAYGEITKGQKIERKRRDWRGYAEAWQGLGMDLPAFYAHLAGVTEHVPDDMYKANLLSALALDRHDSREALLASVEALLKEEKPGKKGHRTLPQRIGHTLGRVFAPWKAPSKPDVSRNIQAAPTADVRPDSPRREGEQQEDKIVKGGGAPMLIEIKGAGFTNKGAELMLHAVLQAVQPAIPEASFAMAPRYGQPSYGARARLGLLQKATLSRHGISWDFIGKMFPPEIREMYGIVLDDEIDVILDVSGYAYGDAFGEHKTILMAKQTAEWKNQGKKVILLPQALGPFSSQRIRDALKRLVDNADLIFARDPVSYAYVNDVVAAPANVKIAPDFTNLVSGAAPKNWNAGEHRVCIIPSHQMTDKTSKTEGTRYIPFLLQCLEQLAAKGITPFLLIHGGKKDLPAARQLQEAASRTIEILSEQDPLKIKGILGQCDLVIASRFHALVSSLSQGVLCIGAGWSHKYETLFADYGCPELLLPIDERDLKIGEVINKALEPESSEAIRMNLRSAAELQRQRAAGMWEEVLEMIRPEMGKKKTQ
ncbi:Coenzyme F420-reducing hydrogenase, beta subunit [Syntrophus gentianae]|uniref:Coenzyme F420-reducing hydrogenase, beta subunit n=1 Tax=Syntrophus gentianae TaxID=43775 RepID=A0A1H7UDE8_9BACT|nr:polysaccharide pyruvyl transferase family protein [Syntrophus gentianae]SEL94839.1 Coenzyme F420-reducing hydrogenase, beta subunit [Syntrophus gentianae]